MYTDFTEPGVGHCDSLRRKMKHCLGVGVRRQLQERSQSPKLCCPRGALFPMYDIPRSYIPVTSTSGDSLKQTVMYLPCVFPRAFERASGQTDAGGIPEIGPLECDIWAYDPSVLGVPYQPCGC